MSETGLLHGFSVQDAIDLVNQSVTGFTAAASGGVASAVDLLRLAGNYAATNLAFQGDGNGGAEVIYQAHAVHALV